MSKLPLYPTSTPLPSDLAPLWEKFLSLYQQKRLPKALLLVNTEHRSPQALIELMLARLLCNETEGPCGHCQHCRLFQIQEHPDSPSLTTPEIKDLLKIDTVRALQETLYLPPQIAERRVVFLGSLERFTPAAVNALLKTIEEPPEKVFFIGITQQIDSVLPTLLSRFQQWVLPTKTYSSMSYLDLTRWSDHSTAYVSLMQQAPQLSDELAHYFQDKLSVVALAEKWSAYPPRDLFTVLYCLFAQIVRSRYIESEKTSQFLELSNWQCFMILQMIETALSQLREIASLNALLMIESWLIEVSNVIVIPAQAGIRS